MKRIVTLVLATGCQVSDGSNLTSYEFAVSTSTPRVLSASEIDVTARSGLHADEQVMSAVAYPAPGLGQTVVQVVVGPREPRSLAAPEPRAFVVDADGRIEPTAAFWRRERAARLARFGRMTPELFAQQAVLSPSDTIDVDIMVRADVPEPMVPYDGTDLYVSTEEFEQWFTDHARAQVARIAQAKSRVISVLGEHAAHVLANHGGLPTVRARVSAALLRSQQLNANDVTRIDAVPDGQSELLGDYAGHASMAAESLSGGMCGGTCDGGLIDVGLWERPPPRGQDSPPYPNGWAAGLAGHTTRLYGQNSVSYLDPPRSCSSDADCYPGSATWSAGVARRSRL